MLFCYCFDWNLFRIFVKCQALNTNRNPLFSLPVLTNKHSVSPYLTTPDCVNFCRAIAASCSHESKRISKYVWFLFG